MAPTASRSSNLFSTRMIPLVLLLSFVLPIKIAGRIGITGSVHKKNVDLDGNDESGSGGGGTTTTNRILGGGYGHKKPVPEPTTPGKHGGYQYVPKHHGHYDYAYIKRPVDPSEYYHNYKKPASEPTSHDDSSSTSEDDDRKPTRHPTKHPTKHPTPYPETSPPTPTVSSAPTGAPTQPVLPPTFEPAINIEIIVDDSESDKATIKPEDGSDSVISFDPPTVQARIAEFALQGGAEFEDPGSYQSAALRRVEEQVGVETFDDIKLMQYYSLYCIYESTSSRTNDFLVQSRIFGDGESDIPGWTITSGWLENDLDPCEGEWYGVHCEDDQVVQLDLYENGLTGNFAPEVLYLSGNGFYSTGAGNLVSLDIFGNEFMSNGGDMSWIQDMGSQLGKRCRFGCLRPIQQNDNCVVNSIFLLTPRSCFRPACHRKGTSTCKTPCFRENSHRDSPRV